MVLRTVSDGSRFQEVSEVLKSLGLMKFAGALMWVLKVVFCLPEDLLICEPNEKLGRMLLEDIMQSGNFGHFDTGRKYFNNVWISGLNNFKRNLRYIPYYPSEVLWAPFWKIGHFVWRKVKGY